MTTAQAEQTQIGLGFWLGWVVAGTVGWGAAWALTGLLSNAIDSIPAWATGVNSFIAIGIVFPIFAALVPGTAVAIIQAILLRKRIARPALWVLQSAIGLGVVGIPFILVGEVVVGIGLIMLAMGPSLAVQFATVFMLVIMVVFAIAGASVGRLQRSNLQKRISRPTRWVRISILSFALIGLALGMPLVEFLARMPLGLGAVAVTMAIPLIVAHAITGAWMVFLFRHPARVDVAPKPAAASA